MGDVIANMSMSLDGFIEDASGGVQHLFGWCAAGPEAFTLPGDGREFRTSAATAEYLRESIVEPGAKVVKGYPNVMPSFKASMTPDDVRAAVEHLKTLK